MDRQTAMASERTLRRIVTLLAALAVLAERAAARSAPVRWFVLLLLRRAETATEAFLFQATGMPAIIEGFDVIGNGREDALRLAARFRALAAAFGALLPRASRPGRRPARRGFACGGFAPGSGRLPGGWPVKPNDTS